MQILVTGGTGFIGSHTVVELMGAGYDTVIVDNLCNSSEDVLSRIEKVAGKRPRFYRADIRDRDALRRVFRENEIDAVIHFAGLKAVGESVSIPLAYYDNNIAGTVALCQVMEEAGCHVFVFSSSATVYGMNNPVPFREDMPTSATNPYGWTKRMLEQILTDESVAKPDWSVVLLRYFNPIGAHPSGLLGEKPNGIPNNLFPYIAKVATGDLPCLNVFGDDYDTPDGTGVRDYIHVTDLARGHLAALEYAFAHKGTEAVNLGTGKGTSVLELVRAFEKASGLTIPCRIAPRRPGDIASCYADTEKAKRLFGWEARYTVDDMCRDGWRFIRREKDGN